MTVKEHLAVSILKYPPATADYHLFSRYYLHGVSEDTGNEVLALVGEFATFLSVCQVIIPPSMRIL